MRGPRAAGLLAAALLVWLGCAVLGRPPLHLSDLASQGDAQRRASLGLVLRGLEEDARARPLSAQSHYERALQVDATNPWAYLALARHALGAGDPARALAFLDQSESLLDPADALRVEAHLVGLRGAALLHSGRGREAQPLLDRAAALAPGVWGDGRLDAQELW